MLAEECCAAGDGSASVSGYQRCWLCRRRLYDQPHSLCVQVLCW